MILRLSNHICIGRAANLSRKKKAYELLEIQSNNDFFDIRWVIYIDWMPEGQTVN